MLRIMIVSDTHHKCYGYDAALIKEGNIDMLIHCGDVEGDEDYIRATVACPVYMVAGNNDYFSGLDRELQINIAGKNVFITHGHNYLVSLGTENIKEEAKSRGCDIVMFGHIHRPILEIEEDIVALNPGSLTYPRQNDHKRTYMMMYVDDDNNCTFEIKSIDD